MKNQILVIETTLKEILDGIKNEADFGGDYHADRTKMIKKIDMYLSLIKEDNIKLKRKNL